MNENNEIRYCKKCGCELMSTNKNKLCENCRRIRNQKYKKRGAVVAAIGGTVAAAIPKVIGKRSNT